MNQINNKILADNHQCNEDCQQIICISCPIGCELTITKNVNNNNEYTVTGNKCPRGKKYALSELTAPQRTVTTTVAIKNYIYPVIPVKTAQPIPKEKIFEIMQIASNVVVNAPIQVGEIIIKNIANTGVNLVATKNAIVNLPNICIP